MKKGNIKKAVLILLLLAGIGGFYYRSDVCFYEIYYPAFTLLILFLITLTIKSDFKKWFKIIYCASAVLIWGGYSYFIYLYFTQFVQHYKPCNW